MPRHPKPKPEKIRYSEAEIPADLAAEAMALASAHHYSLAFLVRLALTTAARCVVDGHGEVLPPASSVKRDDAMTVLRWGETGEESTETVRLLRKAKSSRAAVIVEYLTAYVAAGGVLVRVEWPVWDRKQKPVEPPVGEAAA